MDILEYLNLYYSISEALEQTIITRPMALQSAQTTSIGSTKPRNQATCIGCRTRFDSVALQKDHFRTEWHLYNLKRRICNLDPIGLNSFNEIQASIPKESVSTPRSSLPSLRDTNYTPGRSQDNNDDDAETNSDDWSEVDDDALIDEDYDEEEAAELLARVVKSDTCLFCDKKSPNCKNNISHMNLIHGFFIPEEKFVIDIEGLMEYLGFKVGAGATCLWCSKQFTTRHGVRLHMLYKDHCKILYDQENADEFKEFYDYSNQEKIEMKPLNLLIVPRKRPERKFDQGRVAKVKSANGQNDKQLVSKKGLPMVFNGAHGSKAIKKFNERRAKNLLRTGMANNNTLRSRLRLQNPM